MNREILRRFPTSRGEITIRWAGPGDAPAICRLINALAAYEKLAHVSDPEEAVLRRHLDRNQWPHCEALLADSGDGLSVGFALFFRNYSTFLTSWGIYLEDLFVEPDFRGSGIGLALLTTLATIAEARGCDRLDWAVLDWNAPAIRFYEQIGARMQGDWRLMRLEGEALGQLAKGALPR